MSDIKSPNRTTATLTSWLWHSPYLLLTLPALFWAGNTVVARAIHETTPPIGLAFWRWVVAFAVLLPIAWGQLRQDLPYRWSLLLMSACGVAAYNTLLYIGLQHTTALNALLMLSSFPLMVPVLAFLVFREQVTGPQLTGTLVSCFGVVFIAGHGSLEALLHVQLQAGDKWVLAGIASYSFYSVLLRKRPPVHPISFLATTFGLGTAMLVPFYVWETLAARPMPLNATVVSAIAFIAIFPSILAYVTFNRGVELVGANQAGQFVHLTPVFGSILAVTVLGESFEVYHLIGFAAIALGLVLATIWRKGA